MEKLWRAKHISLPLKLNIFYAAVISIFLSGCETWIIIEVMTSKTNSFATSCFRILPGIKRIDKITNKRVYQLVNRQPQMHTVRQRQIRWIGHALRQDNDEPSKQLCPLWTVNNKKKGRGRPRGTYRAQIADLFSPGVEAFYHEIDVMAINRTF